MLLSLWEDLHSSALTTPFPEIYYAAHTINSVGCIQNLPDTGYLELFRKINSGAEYYF